MAKKKIKLVKSTIGYSLSIQREGGVMDTVYMGVTKKSQEANWRLLRDVANKAIVNLDHPALEGIVGANNIKTE